MTIVAFAPPFERASVVATAFTLSVAATGTTGTPTAVTVTPNGTMGASVNVLLAVAGGGTLALSGFNFPAGSSAAQSTTLTRSADGTSTLTLTNDGGLGNNGSPATFASSTPSPLDWTAAAYCSFGDSLTQGVGGPAYASSYLPTYDPILTAGSPVADSGHAGETTVSLLSFVSDATSKYVAGKTNVLGVWAGTNDIQTGSTARQTADGLWALIAACKAAKPWKIAVMTTIPRYQALKVSGSTPPVDDTKSAALNAVIDAYNTIIRAEWALHADLLVDLRAGSSPWNISSYTSADFTGVNDGLGHALYWPEPSTTPTQYIHLINWGYDNIAKLIAARLGSMPA